jgi:hypothetical protein
MSSMKKLILTFCLLSLNIVLHAQNIMLRNFSKQQATSNEYVQFLVKGNYSDVAEALVLCNGVLKYHVNNIYAVSIPASKALLFSTSLKNAYTEFSDAKGELMADSMLIHNRVDSARAGLGILPRGYDGEGVVIGIIDSGIDFTHPDFKNTDGTTRIKFIWDQTQAFDAIRTPQPYNYGQEWNNADIDGGICTHDDQAAYWGHGSNVAGVAAGNGLAVGMYEGVAPKADIIAVSSNFSSSNWTNTIADAVHYIFAKADSLGKPCVINASLGTYLGSHDGTDLAAQIIVNLVNGKNGRAFVCAAGNAGHLSFHVGKTVNTDTSFTWFQYNPSFGGYGAVYFQLWADTANFNNVHFSVGADIVNPYFEHRGKTNFDVITNRLNQLISDTIYNSNGNKLAVVDTWAEIIGPNYFMEVHIQQPDSNSNYRYRFSTTGSGRWDVWSASFLGTSNIISSIPTPVNFPEIVNYVLPDFQQNIVSSWNCSPDIISVANYINRTSYIDYNGNTTVTGGTQGALFFQSSRGPNRHNYFKPDIGASSNVTLCTARLASAATLIAAEPFKVAPGGMHYRNGGTSIASPVVTGIAALYLQRCPDASMAEIKNAIINNAYKDVHTGLNLPDNNFGYGKVNAFATLASSVFQVNIMYSGDTNLCAGESIILTAPAGYAQYQWSNGAISPSITVNQAGTYSVEVFDSSFCSGVSAPVGIAVHPLPAAPLITQNGLVLSSTAAATYQWYYEGWPIPGATQQSYTVIANGRYKVKISSIYGCEAVSDTLMVSNVGTLEAEEDNKIGIFPNPNEGKFYVILKETNSPLHITICNMQGKTVFETQVNTTSSTIQEINLPNISKGMYVITVINGENKKIQKLLVR